MVSRTVSLELPEELAQAIERQAQRSGRDLSAFVAEALSYSLRFSLPPFDDGADVLLHQQVSILEDWVATLLARLSEFDRITNLDEATLRRMETFERSIAQFLSVLTFTSQEQPLPWSSGAGLGFVMANSQPVAVLDQILSTSPELVFVQDRLGRFVYINAAGANVFRNNRSYFLGKTLEELELPNDIVEPLTCHLEDVFVSGQSVRGEIGFPAGQDFRDYEYIFSPVRGVGGSIDAVVFMARDISQHRQTEIALQQSEEMYRFLFDAAGEAILIVEFATGNLLNANWTAARQLGYSRRELLELTIHNIELGMDGWSRDLITRKLEIDGSAVYENIYQRKNGTEFPVEISAQVIEYDDR
jgi:PAS domain S-box-containing protein